MFLRSHGAPAPRACGAAAGALLLGALALATVTCSCGLISAEGTVQALAFGAKAAVPLAVGQGG